MSHLLRSIGAQDKTRLVSILKKPREEKTAQEVAWITDTMQQYGSVQHAQALARAFKEEAEAMFRDDLAFLSLQPARSHIETLMEFVLERDH